MNKNKEIEFEKIGAGKFMIVESFELKRWFDGEGGVSSTELVLRLVQSPDGWAKRLVIFFSNIQGLEIAEIGSIGGLHLSIASVKDSGMEGIDYRVSNAEPGKFSFYCSDFSFLIF